MYNEKQSAMKLKAFRHLYLKLIVMIFSGFFLVAPAFSQVTEKTAGDGQEMKVAKEMVAAYEAGDWDELRENVAPYGMFYNLGSYDSLTLDQTINYWKKGRETATPKLVGDGIWLATTVDDGPRKGKWILHWGNNTLTYPSGETVSFPYHVAMKFRNEQVEQAHFYYDNNKIIRALGYEIQPPLEELNKNTEMDEDDQ